MRSRFYQKIMGKDVGEVKAIWSKLVFTGKAAAPKEYRTSAEVKKAIASDPNGIGYIEKSGLAGSVQAIFTIEERGTGVWQQRLPYYVCVHGAGNHDSR